MVNRGAKPNRRVEEALHHGPVTGIVDAILVGEIRQMCHGGKELADAHRAAMQISWRLQAISGSKVPKV